MLKSWSGRHYSLSMGILTIIIVIAKFIVVGVNYPLHCSNELYFVWEHVNDQRFAFIWEYKY